MREWIIILISAVPLRSHACFIELLCDCVISPEGCWVMREPVRSAVARVTGPTTYYKLLQRDNLRTVQLARALLLRLGLSQRCLTMCWPLCSTTP